MAIATSPSVLPPPVAGIRLMAHKITPGAVWQTPPRRGQPGRPGAGDGNIHARHRCRHVAQPPGSPCALRDSFAAAGASNREPSCHSGPARSIMYHSAGLRPKGIMTCSWYAVLSQSRRYHALTLGSSGRSMSKLKYR